MNEYNYLMYAEEFIKNAFSEVTPCAQQEFADPDEEDDGNQDEEEERYEASQYCQGVMEQETVSFSNCYAEEKEEGKWDYLDCFVLPWMNTTHV